MNYELVQLSGTALAPQRRRAGRFASASSRALPTRSAAIVRARRQNARAAAWEDLAWMAVGLCSLIVVVMSLFG